MIYYVESEATGLIKIGTSERVQSRLKQLAKEHNSSMTLRALADGDRKEEKRIHEMFSLHREFGEWFRPHDELLSHIENVGLRAIPRDKVRVFTVRVDDAFKLRVQDEASSVGVKGWTAMLVILAREALARRESQK